MPPCEQLRIYFGVVFQDLSCFAIGSGSGDEEEEEEHTGGGDEGEGIFGG